MHVSKQDDRLIIQFKYNPVLVQLMQRFGGREYDDKRKIWKVPIAQLPTVHRILKNNDFSFEKELEEENTNILKTRKKLKRIKKGKFNQIEIDTLRKSNPNLFQYQQIGVGFICTGKKVFIGDQPGTGKTIQTLTAIDVRKLTKNLIVCPASIKETWAREIEKWYPNKSKVILRGNKMQREKAWSSDSNFYITNYESLIRDLKIVKKLTFQSVIVDEATKISNFKTKISKTLKKIKSEYRVALTGTPLSNRIEDIWNIIDFCVPGALGSYGQFINKYTIRDKFGNIKEYKNLQALGKQLSPYFIRRLKSEVLKQLPPKIFADIHVEFSDEEQELYTAIKKNLVKDAKAMGMWNTRGLKNMFVKDVRLQQAANSAELLNGKKVSAKEEALSELLESICTADNKVIIFTQSKKMALILMRDFAKYGPLLIAGGVSEKIRDENEIKFNNNPENTLLIMTDAGAYGLNLQQKSKTVIHYDLPWSLEKRTQREDRVHRIGQTGNVIIYQLLVKNTIDEYKIEVLYRKQTASDELTGDTDRREAINLEVEDIYTLLK